MFGSAAARKQHAATAHVQGSRKRSSGQGAGVGAGAPISTRVEVRTRETDSATVSGQDRLLHVADIKNRTHGSIIVSEMVTPASFVRLSKIASAWQRVVWVELMFRVVTQITSAVSGGYVAAFVRDPADDGPAVAGENSLIWLTSQQGAVASKWWQSSNLRIPLEKRSYYTSVGVDVRDYSPGRFVLAVDGVANQSGSVTVYAHWRVRLTEGSLEVPSETTSPVTSITDVGNINGKKGLYALASSSAKWSSMFSEDFPDGTYFQLPSAITWSVGATVHTVWFVVKSTASAVFFAKTRNSGAVEGVNDSDQLLIPQGTVLIPVFPHLQGECQGSPLCGEVESSCLETLRGLSREQQILVLSQLSDSLLSLSS